MEVVRARMYGVMIALGIVVGMRVAEMVEKSSVKKSRVADGLVWVVIGGIVGARAYHVIDYWQYYSEQLVEIVKVWHGGLGIWGALVGGVIGLAGYCWRNKLGYRDFWLLVDAASVGVPFAQAIGRWGNYFNRELYGLPTSLPWGIEIPVEYRSAEVVQYNRFHPLFLYESLLSLGLGLVLVLVWKKQWFKLGSGGYLGAYLVGYGLIRASLEGLRIDNWQVGGVAVASVVAGAAIVGGIGLVVQARKEMRSR